jgi:RNA polymerase sigma-70 factor (ECF subfamily)
MTKQIEPSLQSPPSSRSSLARIVEAGLAAWPRLPIDREAFAHHVAAMPSPKRAYAGDLLLAFACASRNDAAIRALDVLVRSEVAAAVARLDLSPSFADDVGQKLREHLLLSSPPTIGTYAGRAALRTWLRSAALRVGLNMRRRREDDPSARVRITSSYAADSDDADLAFLRARYRDQFSSVLREALQRLPERDRRILHLHLAERATLERLATLHDVGISTMARWMTGARERLAEDVRTTLRERLRLTSSEYDGIARLVSSELDVSMAAVLGGPGTRR